jgi:hypothetical protein
VQTRCVSLSFCMYRVMTKRASRAARTIQMLMRIGGSPNPGSEFWPALASKDHALTLAVSRDVLTVQ